MHMNQCTISNAQEEVQVGSVIDQHERIGRMLVCALC